MDNQHNNLIFYSLRTQYENLGDLMINKILIENLRDYGNLIVDDQGVPDWFCKELGITTDERGGKYETKFNFLVLSFAWKRLFQKGQKTYLVTPPGHIYNATPKIKPGDILKVALFSLLLKSLGVRICRFGASIGPFYKLGQMAEWWQSKLMYFYSVRDSISEKYAHSIGINSVRRFPDLAWLLTSPDLSHPSPISKDSYVVFSFRESSHSQDNSQIYKNHLYAVLDEIVDLICHQWNKKLLITYQVDRDYQFCREIKDRYHKIPDVHLVDRKINQDDMYSFYSQAEMIFSNRLHVLMFGMACGAIPIAVIDSEKHDKITGIFSDAGLRKLIVDIHNTTPHAEWLSEIASNVNFIKQEIHLCFQKQRNLADEIFQEIM